MTDDNLTQPNEEQVAQANAAQQPVVTPTPIEDPERELNRPEIPDVNVPPSPLLQEEMEPSFPRQVQHLLRQIIKQGLKTTLIEARDQLHRRIRGAPLKNRSRITQNLYVGGQYNEKGWERLKSDRGVTAVVNMRAEYNEADHGFGPEPAQYCYLPTPDGYAPKLADIRKGVDFIREQIAKGGTVYVHCWEGVGRAPTVAAAYLTTTGLTPSEAWGTIKKVRPYIRPTRGQLAVVDAFAQEWGMAEQPSLTEKLAAETQTPTPVVAS